MKRHNDGEGRRINNTSESVSDHLMWPASKASNEEASTLVKSFAGAGARGWSEAIQKTWAPGLLRPTARATLTILSRSSGVVKPVNARNTSPGSSACTVNYLNNGRPCGCSNEISPDLIRPMEADAHVGESCLAVGGA